MWQKKTRETPESLAKAVPSTRVNADSLKTKGLVWLVTGLEMVSKCLEMCRNIHPFLWMNKEFLKCIKPLYKNII